jgi:spore coat polysaccharide biosynthesis protein SpsF
MKTVAIIQARLGSRRLPEKVFADVGGKPMLARVVARAEQSQTIDQVIVATTDRPHDRAIVNFCKRSDWPVVTGSEDDVLQRYVDAARFAKADRIVRITSDCPLIDPGIIDRVVGKMKQNDQLDYVANFFPRRWYPRGLDAEVVTRATLEQLAATVDSPNFREHVTLSIYRNPDRYRIGSVCCDDDQSHHRWTVDTPADLELIRIIYSHFGDSNFNWREVLTAFHCNPHWFDLNRNIQQKVA